MAKNCQKKTTEKKRAASYPPSLTEWLRPDYEFASGYSLYDGKQHRKELPNGSRAICRPGNICYHEWCLEDIKRRRDAGGQAHFGKWDGKCAVIEEPMAKTKSI